MTAWQRYIIVRIYAAGFGGISLGLALAWLLGGFN